MNPNITILVATHRRVRLLRQLLESLVRMSRLDLLERVVVIENGSKAAGDLCAGFAGELPLRYFHRSESGKSRALQWYLEQIETGFLLFLDDDARVCPQLLTRYAATIDLHGPRKYYGGELRVDYEAVPPAWLRPHLPPSATGWDGGYRSLVEHGRRFFSGSNYGAFVEDLKLVGGFRCDLGPGAMAPGTSRNPTGQDWDVQKRLLRSGMHPVFVEDAPVWHYVPCTRCSPDWALNRSFRDGYAAGIRGSERAIRTGKQGRYAVRLLTRYLKARTLASLARIAGSPERQFLLQRRLYNLRGQRKGHAHEQFG